MANADEISQFFRGALGRASRQERQRDRIHWLVAEARGRVLDLGCSQGIVVDALRPAGLEVLGIDYDEDRIAYALADRETKPAEVRERLEFRRRRCDRAGPARRELRHGDLRRGDRAAARSRRGAPRGRRVAKPDATVLVTTPFGYLAASRSPADVLRRVVRRNARPASDDRLARDRRRLPARDRPPRRDGSEHAASVIVAAQPGSRGEPAGPPGARIGRPAASACAARSDWAAAGDALERRQRRQQRRIRKLSAASHAQRRSRWTRLGRALARGPDAARASRAAPQRRGRAAQAAARRLRARAAPRRGAARRSRPARSR